MISQTNCEHCSDGLCLACAKNLVKKLEDTERDYNNIANIADGLADEIAYLYKGSPDRTSQQRNTKDRRK